MRVLWIVNMVFPILAKELNIKTGVSGGWMFDLSKQISESPDTELAVACVYSGNTFQKCNINNITYYLLPGGGKKLLFYSKSLIPFWEKVHEDFKPDIVHLHGTEYSHGLVYMDTFPEDKYLLTIQGIIDPISRELNAGLSFFEKFNSTFNELIKLNGMIPSEYLFKKNANNEQRIISNVKYATGRTFWDKAMMQSVNPKLKYFRCNYNLREEFYEAPKWDIEKCERHVIYGSTSAQTALKGGHILLKALSIVKKVYPDVVLKLLMPGSVNGEFNITSGFKKYEKKLIDKYNLWDNIRFIPSQNAEGVISHMNSSHCAVIPSAMENASSTLREAMHLGVPCIASYRGGMTELINDKEDGFFFDFPEYKYLAARIVELFENDDLCIQFSEKSKEKAALWHDRVKNTQDMLNVYKYIADSEAEKHE